MQNDLRVDVFDQNPKRLGGPVGLLVPLEIWRNGRLHEWLNGGKNARMKEKWVNEWKMIEWMKEWLIEWMKEWLNEWKYNWMSESMIERNNIDMDITAIQSLSTIYTPGVMVRSTLKLDLVMGWMWVDSSNLGNWWTNLWSVLPIFGIRIISPISFGPRS